MRLRTLPGAFVLTMLIGVASSAQWFEIRGNQWENATNTNIALLRESATPTTLWAKFNVTSRLYDWNNFRAGVVIASKKLANPINLPGIGTIRVDLGHVVFADLAMKTKYIKSWTNFNNRPTHGIYGWTTLPPISSNLVGTELFVQFVAYQATSNPLYLTSPLYHSDATYPLAILPRL